MVLLLDLLPSPAHMASVKGSIILFPVAIAIGDPRSVSMKVNAFNLDDT
jgi:hypothetical protein